MPDRRAAMLGVALVTLGVMVAGLLLAHSWETKPRSFSASVPQPAPLTSTPVVRVGPDQRVCISPVTVLPTSEVALVRVGTRSKPGVDVSAVVEAAGGYRSSDSIPGSAWKDNDLLAFVLDPPGRALEGRFCVRNEGRWTIDLYGADDRTKSLSVTRVGGRPQRANIQLAFAERAPGSVAGHRQRIAERITAFRPAVIATPVVWILAVLVLLALTIGGGVALTVALRSDDDDRRPPRLTAEVAPGPTPDERPPASAARVPTVPPRGPSRGT
jgi:hypothetical protein